MTTSQPTIDEILRPFFDRRLEGTTGIKRQRIERVEQLLRTCLEAEGEQILVERDRTILAAERAFQAEGAFARTMRADDLAYVLPIFLEPPWLQPDRLLQRVQLHLADALTGHLVYGRLVTWDDSCILWEIRGGIDRAKWELNRDRREKQRARRHAANAELAARRAASRVF